MRLELFPLVRYGYSVQIGMVARYYYIQFFFKLIFIDVDQCYSVVIFG